jgi:glycerol uptake facilitator-like aquaporin
MLLCAVIGSGIMGERLSGGNVAVALLANTLATVFALFVLIETLGPVSGAHFNPVVTLVLARTGRFAPPGGALWAAVGAYVAAQLLGSLAGAWLAHLMFELPVLQWSSKLRSGPAQWLAEAVATAGLVFVVLRSPAGRAGALVACYIGAAYWFTASTSFANPAAVLGRMVSDSFAGIAPASAAGFVLAQCVGGALGAWAARVLAPAEASAALADSAAPAATVSSLASAAATSSSDAPTSSGP